MLGYYSVHHFAQQHALKRRPPSKQTAGKCSGRGFDETRADTNVPANATARTMVASKRRNTPGFARCSDRAMRSKRNTLVLVATCQCSVVGRGRRSEREATGAMQCKLSGGRRGELWRCFGADKTPTERKAGPADRKTKGTSPFS